MDAKRVALGIRNPYVQYDVHTSYVQQLHLTWRGETPQKKRRAHGEENSPDGTGKPGRRAPHRGPALGP